MKKRTYHFAAISKITLEHSEGDNSSVLKNADVRLEVSGNLDKSQYIDGKGLPRKEAMKPITNALLHGLIVNMRFCADKGWWKEGEHMQYIIDQLNKAFVHPGDTVESTMEY
jgi:hypothetical protein